MPKRVDPPLPTEVGMSIDALGSRVRVGLIRHLLAHGPKTRPDLAREMNLSSSMVAKNLDLLEELGVVMLDPPRSEPDRKPRRYVVQQKRVNGMLKTLSMALTGAL
ncbi:winged helix-turn-helix transcriptional regulator (plasmid) [Clavibacter capsici]|uniref:Winged helix-turn-helix transcriptional regulator n=2 Tax=Clavibacter capsici TaxID=1874630 RepID=A0AAE6XTK4_9MICO|nr:winged helix-turn-helix domain-containing protein [Clavibacter capsici]QIS40499.1 winged helix-turn-helix transcriptional regulator [Clavibacter capsici]QIS43570.1 winged helix-turn-helix transcriptional regulator [Clavibacter capsici]QIS46493.1 winged helix-turn-helix transcriptional regulator [Clavibacter capsici]